MNKKTVAGVSCTAGVFNRISTLGRQVFGRAWLPPYLGPIYPGVIVHKMGNAWNGIQATYDSALRSGESESGFFERSGIAELAQNNGGAATFWMGKQPALYINAPGIKVLRNENLELAGDSIIKYAGNVMAILVPIGQKHAQLRQMINAFSLPPFLSDATQSIQKNTMDFLRAQTGDVQSLKRFMTQLVLTADSLIPGFLDLKTKTLADYLGTKFEPVLLEFVKNLLLVVVEKNDEGKDVLNQMPGFIKDLIRENFKALQDAPKTNLIRAILSIENVPFPASLEEIEDLDNNILRSIGHGITTAFDTSISNMQWMVSFVESHPEIKQKVIEAASKELHEEPTRDVTYIEKVVLESLRMATMPKDVFVRVVKNPYTVEINQHSVLLNKGSMIHIDLQQISRNSETFKDPKQFNPENITDAMAVSGAKSLAELLALNRFEITSFLATPAQQKSRKCPGRLFAVNLQANLLRMLYGTCDIAVTNLTLERQPHQHIISPKPGAEISICLKKS